MGGRGNQRAEHNAGRQGPHVPRSRAHRLNRRFPRGTKVARLRSLYPGQERVR
jgi:hypothetical protein